MKLKHAALFLLLAVIAEVLISVFHQVTTMVEYKMYDIGLIQWLHFTMSTLAALGLGLIGWAVYRRNDFSTVRPAAIFLAIMATCWTLLGAYNLTEGLIKSWEWFSGNKLRVLSFLLMQMVPVAILVFSLSLLTGKMRRASWWLFAGGTAWLIWLLFDRFTLLVTYGFKHRDTITFIRELLKYVSLAYPVSLIVFGLKLPDKQKNAPGSVLTDSDNLLDELPEEEETVASAETAGLSLKQWMATFLLSAIPLAGTVLLIVWAADLKSRIRGNWAAAMLLLQTLLLLLYTIAYVEPMAYLLGMRDLKFYLAIVVFVFLAIAIGLIVYRRNHLAYEESELRIPSIGNWAGTIFLSGLPLIGLILLIVWSNDKADRIRRNWAIAQLIWLAVMVVYYFYAYMALLDIREYQVRTTFQF